MTPNKVGKQNGKKWMHPLAVKKKENRSSGGCRLQLLIRVRHWAEWLAQALIPHDVQRRGNGVPTDELYHVPKVTQRPSPEDLSGTWVPTPSSPRRNGTGKDVVPPTSLQLRVLPPRSFTKTPSRSSSYPRSE